MLSSGSATIDARTNMVIVQDTPAKLAEVQALIQKIDISVKQVLIEARVVIADDKFSRQLGARFGVGARVYNNGRNIGITGTLIGDPNQANVPGTGIATGFSPSSYWRIKPDAQTGALTGEYINSVPYNELAGKQSGGYVGHDIFNLGNGNLVNLELSAAEAANGGKVISSPRVGGHQQHQVLNFTRSGIKVVGFRRCYGSSVVTVRACLDVTPQNPRSPTSMSPRTPRQPDRQYRRVSTKVIRNNGDTAVLGGIYEEVTLPTPRTKYPCWGSAGGWQPLQEDQPGYGQAGVVDLPDTENHYRFDRYRKLVGSNSISAAVAALFLPHSHEHAPSK